MSCKTIKAILQPITSHIIEFYEGKGHKTELETSPNFTVKSSMDYQFKFNYCVSFRDPNLAEWIVARGYWNDEGLRFADGIWRDQ